MNSLIQVVNLGGGGGVLVVTLVSDLPASATSGQIAFVTSNQKLYIYNGTSWVLVGGQGNLLGNAGATALALGIQSKAIVFNTAMVDTSYALVTSIQNVTDSDPIYLQIVSTVKSTTGFTVVFNAPIDTANYVLDWQAAGAV